MDGSMKFPDWNVQIGVFTDTMPPGTVILFKSGATMT